VRDCEIQLTGASINKHGSLRVFEVVVRFEDIARDFVLGFAL
jgi:hypothetical protein